VFADFELPVNTPEQADQSSLVVFERQPWASTVAIAGYGSALIVLLTVSGDDNPTKDLDDR
jgi:hypothetical protein